MAFRPKLSKRQKVLSKRVGAIRREKFERLDLIDIERGSLDINFNNSLAYIGGKVKVNGSYGDLAVDEGIFAKAHIGGRTLTFPTAEMFELWVVRRIQRAYQYGKISVKDKLLGVYSLFILLGFSKW